MRYLSVCSGIEAASVAWHPLGWEPVAFSEIEKFPDAALRHHFPAVPNHGDMTKFQDWPDHAIDLLVGGTPCQSFSVAGLRQGLTDPRGNLMLTYLAIADCYRPKWIVWENVPGVLSSNGGRDFGAFLGALVKLGYGFAYRVLDAQFIRVDGLERAVPQRRRRVFVVGHIGDWRRAAAVLFDRESVSGNPAPRRKAGQGFTRGIEIGPSGGGLTDVNPTLDTRAKDGPIRNQLSGAVMCAAVAPTLNAQFGNKQGLEDQHINGGDCSLPPVSHCLNAGGMGRIDYESETLIPMTGGGFDVAHALRGEGFDASEDGTGRGTPIVPVAHPLTAGMSASAARMPHEQGALITVAIQERAVSENPDNGPQGAGFKQDGTACTLEARNKVQAVAFDCKGTEVQFSTDGAHSTLRSMGHASSHQNAGGHAAVAFDMRGREGGAMMEGPHDTANIRAASGGSSRSYIAQPWAVRRLTPTECERLQGFPDGWTDIPIGNRRAADGPRYKALGNSMAVNAMRWIGTRIQEVENIE